MVKIFEEPRDTRPKSVVPMFADGVLTNNPMIYGQLQMLRKAFGLAQRMGHPIISTVVDLGPKRLDFMSNFGLLAYRALSVLPVDSEEAATIIGMLSSLVTDYRIGKTPVYEYTETMRALERDDYEFVTHHLRSDAVQRPAPPNTLKPGEDIFLTCTTTLSETVREELQAVLERHYTGARAAVLDFETRNLVKHPVSVTVEYTEQGVYQANFHVIGTPLDETAMNFIIANLKEADGKTSTYITDGPNVLMIHIEMDSVHSSDDIRELVRVAIQNNIIHSLLTVSHDRYTKEIAFK